MDQARKLLVTQCQKVHLRLFRAERGRIPCTDATHPEFLQQAHRHFRSWRTGTLRRPHLQFIVRAGQKRKGWGAEIIGYWPIARYTYDKVAAEVDGRFLGLIIDQRTQGI